MNPWDNIANEYHNFIGKDGDLLRKELLDPLLFSQIPENLQGMNVLDLGCGNGYLSTKLAKMGANVVGVDSSKMLIELARINNDHPNIRYVNHDLEKRWPFKNAQFDLIICHLVLIDINNYVIIYSEANRTLKIKKRFIFSITHPCFSYPTAKYKRKLLGRIRNDWGKMITLNYLREEKFYKNVGGKFKKTTPYYHRTISTYLNSLVQADFGLINILETRPSSEFLNKHPKFYHLDKFPQFMIVVGEKLL